MFCSPLVALIQRCLVSIFADVIKENDKHRYTLVLGPAMVKAKNKN